jgi:hypothetical protein
MVLFPSAHLPWQAQALLGLCCEPQILLPVTVTGQHLPGLRSCQGLTSKSLRLMCPNLKAHSLLCQARE